MVLMITFPTQMCMDYDPQLCYKTDNVIFVTEENILGYKQSTPHRCCCCYSRRCHRYPVRSSPLIGTREGGEGVAILQRFYILVTSA